jgi:hypothetical protein
MVRIHISISQSIETGPDRRHHREMRMLAAAMAVSSSPAMQLQLPSAPTSRSQQLQMLQSSDGVLLVAAGSLALAAGLLQAELSGGEKGINAFLMKEKGSNPYYRKDYKKVQPPASSWLKGLRLPDLPFVEVYGQESRGAGGGVRLPNSNRSSARVANLYQQLDQAIDCEDYKLASELKRSIDEALLLDGQIQSDAPEGESDSERPVSER